MNDMTYYIAGPMSWYPQFNVPLFDEVTAKLRELGNTVISPAELDSAEIRKAALASETGDPGVITGTIESYGEIIGRDVEVIIDKVDALVLLPEWECSTGANIEVCTAVATGKVLFTYTENGLIHLSYDMAWHLMAQARKGLSATRGRYDGTAKTGS